MKDPILITGAARSGTSMVAGVINMCGAFGGDMAGANKYNAKGMFENVYIRNQIVKPFLREQGYDAKGQYPLPDVADIQIPQNWRQRIEAVMAKQGLSPNQSWFYKGAKICLFWPVWSYSFPDAKYIIVRRKTSDIVNSCLKTGFMTAFTNSEKLRAVEAKNEREGWLWWVHQHEERFSEMIHEGLNVKVVWPERMLNGNFKQMREAIEWLGLEWNSDVYNFIDEKLWKSRKK